MGGRSSAAADGRGFRPETPPFYGNCLQHTICYSGSAQGKEERFALTVFYALG